MSTKRFYKLSIKHLFHVVNQRSLQVNVVNQRSLQVNVVNQRSLQVNVVNQRSLQIPSSQSKITVSIRSCLSKITTNSK